MEVRVELEYRPQFQLHVQLAAVFDGPGVEFAECVDVSRIAVPREGVSGEERAPGPENTVIRIIQAPPGEDDEELIKIVSAHIEDAVRGQDSAKLKISVPDIRRLLNTKLVGPLFELFADCFEVVVAGVPPELASASTLNDLASFLNVDNLRRHPGPAAGKAAGNIESRLDIDLESILGYFVKLTGKCDLNEVLSRMEGSYFLLRLQSNPQYYGLAPREITARTAFDAPRWALAPEEVNGFVNELLEEAVGSMVVVDGVATL